METSGAESKPSRCCLATSPWRWRIAPTLRWIATAAVIGFTSCYLVVVGLLCSIATVFAQTNSPRCDALVQKVIDLRGGDRATEHNILEARLNAARDALHCFDKGAEIHWITWLLIQKIVALDGLQRYEEAQHVVDGFFEQYASEDDSVTVARFYMWDMRLNNLLGNYDASQRSYERGLPYAPYLPEEWRYEYYLNASNIAGLQGHLKEALEIAQRVRTQLPPNPDSSMRGVVGRALLRTGELAVELGFTEPFRPDSIRRTIAQLQRAKSFVTLNNDSPRYIIATIAQGLAYALLDEFEGSRPYLDEALNEARRNGLRREEIYALYGRARFWHLQQRYGEALADLEDAHTLTLQSGILEFEARRAYLEAQVHEEMKGFDDAQTAYRRAVDVADETGTGRDLKIKVASLEAIDRIRGRALLNTSSTGSAVYLLAGLTLALLSLLVYLALRPPYWLRRWLAGRDVRPAPLHLEPAEPVIPPSIPPSIARTLAYIWLLCFHLEQWAETINRLDPALLGKLTDEDITLPALYATLRANPEGVLIASSEADAISHANRKEHGGFSQLFRKAFHHERAQHGTKTDGNLRCPRPRIALVVSGTPEQFKPLVASIRNGLYSRFMTLVSHAPLRYISQRGKPDDRSFDAYQEEARQHLLRLYKALEARTIDMETGRKEPLYFDVSAGLWDRVDDAFRGLFAYLFEGTHSPPEALSASVFRGALITFRIAMVLALLRHFEQGAGLSRAASVAASEADIEAAVMLGLLYAEHSITLAYALSNGDDQAPAPDLAPVAGTHRMSAEQRQFFEALPAAFETAEAHALAEEVGVARRRLFRWLERWLETGLLKKQRHGHYAKRVTIDTD